jgi:hypothetical protein
MAVAWRDPFGLELKKMQQNQRLLGTRYSIITVEKTLIRIYKLTVSDVLLQLISIKSPPRFKLIHIALFTEMTMTYVLYILHQPF